MAETDNCNRSSLCPCGDARVELTNYFEQGETDFKYCAECNLLIRWPMPSQADLDEIYRVHYSSENIIDGCTNQETGDYALRKYLAYLEERYVNSNSRILDYGAGSGAFVELMRERGFSCDGYETSVDARQFSAEVRGIGLFGDLSDVPKDTYDCITVIEVIEHLTNVWQDLKIVQSLLKPGGLAFITTPNRKGIRAKMEKGFWKEARKKFHLILFDKKSLKYQLEKANFVNIDFVKYSPIQKAGIRNYIQGRMFQLVNMPGTLCVMASKDKH